MGLDFSNISTTTPMSLAEKKMLEYEKKAKELGFRIKDRTTLGFLMIPILFVLIIGAFVGAVIYFEVLRNNEKLLKLVLILTSGALLTIPFYAGFSMIKIKTKPRQKFFSKEETKNHLKSFNNPNSPLEIVETPDYDLMLRFRLNDDRWKETLYRESINKAYKLFIRLDESKKTAYIVEQVRGISWKGRQEVPEYRINRTIRIICDMKLFNKKEITVWDTYDLFQEIPDYEYHIKRIKCPVINKLLRLGWTVKPRVMPFLVKKKK